ncbi:MAG TPA: PKD domain-containing protein, partial [Roseiflexaceae bacterium]|nr:PKD domain-containing protein [Roseiflexaceae bacterium]
APTVVFEVDYSGFSPQAQQAFQRAVDIWSELIVSPVPIHVSASFTPLDANVLGAAGPNTVSANFSQAPFANTWYPVALANKISGSDLNGSQPEIVAHFNSSFSAWYFGTDGNTPFQDYDFVSVVLHELGHGLGLVDSMEVSGGQGSWGMNGRALVYDRFVESNDGRQLIDTSNFPNPSAGLGASLTSGNLFFDGTNANAAAGGRPRLFAPNPYQQGSSISHLNLASYPPGDANSLMTPALSNGVSTHNPGPIVLGIFKDLGWGIEAPTDTPITGLAAGNDGPTTIGGPTKFTASVGAGTNVAYAWDFGDGKGGEGANVEHTYAAVGEYNATVTASNAAGTQTASTTVVVNDVPIGGLTASANGPTNLGNPTTFTASVSAGTNVVFSWDFDDGQS